MTSLLTNRVDPDPQLRGAVPGRLWIRVAVTLCFQPLLVHVAEAAARSFSLCVQSNPTRPHSAPLSLLLESFFFHRALNEAAL